MMTTVSIDLAGTASDVGAVTALGETASCRLSEVNPSVTSGEAPLSRDAASLFQQTLAEQSASNAALGETMRAAMVSVSETLTQLGGPSSVAAKTNETEAVPSVVEPLPQQIAENATLGAELAVSSARVAESLAKVADVSGQTVVVPAVREPLPQQIAENATLGAELAVSSASVAESLAKVADVSGQTEAVPSVVEPLPQQIAENATLGAELSVSSASAAESLAKVADVSGQTVVVPAVREPLPQQIAENATLETELTESLALGEAASRRLSELSPSATGDETPLSRDVDDLPEASADALVAAGVAPQTATPVTSGETSLPQAVSSVEAVLATAATPSADVLVQAASAVADTLLVSPGLLRGQGEVIVQLRPDVLDGTEVKIAVTGRQLEVVFQPQTIDTAVLIENCRTQLVQHLSAKIASFNVSVDVRKKRS